MLKILLVDDDLEEFELFKSACEHILPETIIVHAEGCEDLVSLVMEYTPDILFMDINMPAINGIECLKVIRAHSRFQSLPVIMYSTSSSLLTIRESFNHKANFYIVKPQTFNGIINALRKVLGIDWKLEPKASLSEFVIA